jgi:hypothetical protein
LARNQYLWLLAALLAVSSVVLGVAFPPDVLHPSGVATAAWLRRPSGFPLRLRGRPAAEVELFKVGAQNFSDVAGQRDGIPKWAGARSWFAAWFSVCWRSGLLVIESIRSRANGPLKPGAERYAPFAST